MNHPQTQSGSIDLMNLRRLLVRQRYELAEVFGFETRNKYEILDENSSLIGYAAEQHKSIFGFLLRQFLGHWRKFDILFFTPDRKLFFAAHHPFRFLFQRLEVRDAVGRPIGAIQQRFSILSKKFQVENERGLILMEVSSPLWRIWTFPFEFQGRELAKVSKKWSGLFTEYLTDKDNFLVEYSSPNLPERERQLVLAAAVFIDLLYFENKAD